MSVAVESHELSHSHHSPHSRGCTNFAPHPIYSTYVCMSSRTLKMVEIVYTTLCNKQLRSLVFLIVEASISAMVNLTSTWLKVSSDIFNLPITCQLYFPIIFWGSDSSKCLTTIKFNCLINLNQLRICTLGEETTH